MGIKFIRKITLAILFALLPVLVAAQTVIQPRTKTKTSFAIVIDGESYRQVQGAVEAYRDVVEADGMGTYIIYDEWESPAQIRKLLRNLYDDKKSPLEGAVFVGDIPIPMLRDAQHLSSAFKMDQNRNWQQSSIPSDRYYDDFGLEFEFLKQDEKQPLYFYYSLTPESKQYLSSDIYTARMRPLENGKEGKYVQLEKYLRKVVAERTSNPRNVVDNISMARGHGYNSESKVAWAGEQISLKEQFPDAFKAGGMVRFMDFEQRFPAKPYYLNEVLRPELDIMLFHHHGSNYYQYLNGYKNGSDPNTSIANVKLYLRGKVLAAVEGGKTREEAVQQYVDYLGVPRPWCEEAFDPRKIEEDSLFNLTLDISVPDILAIAPNARFVMFDACYNGSFHRDEYITGAYIFNNGSTIVAQGNTVNAIQDKWPDEFIGLMAGGIRIGQWGKHVHFLETHIIGDPTYRFANTALDFDINAALTLHVHDTKYWLKLVSHPHPDVQAMAYSMLHANRYPGLSDMLRKAYFNSPSGIVRMEALKLLGRIDNRNFIDVLKAAVDDSYELVRRFAIEYICKNGSDELIPAFVHSIVRDNTSERVWFKVGNFMKLLDFDKLAAEIDRQLAQTTMYDNTLVAKVKDDISNARKSYERDMGTIMDRTSEDKYKKQEILSFRNHPAARAIGNLLEFAGDDSRPLELRLYALESLGWYNFSHRRAEVIGGLTRLLQDPVPEVASMARKGINRLSGL